MPTVLCVKTTMAEERFVQEVKEPLEWALKHIQLVNAPEQERADLYIVRQHELELLFEQGELTDLRLLSASKEWNAERFEPHMLAWGIADNGGMYALPYANENVYPLYYNKAIFDSLDVPYPTDGMTWEEAIALAGKVNKRVDGNPIVGLDPADLALMRMQLAVSYFDAETGEPNMLHPDWRSIARTLKSIHSLEGNRLPKEKHWLRFNGRFVRDRTVAMGVVCGSCFAPKDFNFEWDVVSYPVFADRPASSANIPGVGLALGAGCADIYAAVEAAAYLVSDEHQRRLARNGVRPSLMDPQIHADFGTAHPLYSGKNAQAFSIHPLAPPVKNKFERGFRAYSHVRTALVEMIKHNWDEEQTLEALNLRLAEACRGELPMGK